MSLTTLRLRSRSPSGSTQKIPPTVAALGVALSTIGHTPNGSIQQEAEVRSRRPSTASSRPHPPLLYTPRSSTTEFRTSTSCSHTRPTFNGPVFAEYRPTSSQSQCPSLSSSLASSTSANLRNSSISNTCLSDPYFVTPPAHAPPPPPPPRSPSITSSTRSPRASTPLKDSSSLDLLPEETSLPSAPPESGWSSDRRRPTLLRRILSHTSLALSSTTASYTSTPSSSTAIPLIFPVLYNRSRPNSSASLRSMNSTFALAAVASAVAIAAVQTMHPVTPQIREEEEDEEVDWAWIMDQGAVEADEVEGRVKEQSVKERWEEWEVPIGGLFGNSCDGMDGEDWIF